VNLMKGAIMASNFVTTVSPTYAQELRTPFYAHGLDGVINQQSGKLEGILNGIDVDLYNPATMSGLAANFNQKTLVKGKAACKTALQQAVGLEENPGIPLIACVSRLVGHKGFSMVTDALHEIMGMDVQMVVLGTGDWQYEEAFRHAQGQYPGRFAAQLTYSAPLSNMIYAGADLFLMPSVSEPCGLSQMVAMRFGTIPVVRETGGLRDTVTPYNKFEGTGRGFTFSNINAGDMTWVLREAVDLFRTNEKAWRGLQKEGMSADFSWKNSAQQYLDIYNRVLG
jgi:starch synthase